MKISLLRRKEGGTSLVDVIMSVAVIGIMSTGIVGSLCYGFYTMGMTRENQRATQIILETVETVRLFNWDQVNTPGFIPTTFTGVYDPQAPVGQQGITYYGTIQTNTVNVGTTINSNMMLMTVSLAWTNRGIPHHRSLDTMIARDGIQLYVY